MAQLFNYSRHEAVPFRPANHPLPLLTNLQLYLAMEEKELGAPLKATKLISEYEKIFRNIRSTFHPAGVPGEIAGKSANVAYASSKILEKYRASTEGDSVLITIIDG
jgi:hypothetical protein